MSSCNTECEDGMDILTNSPRVRWSREYNIKLMLSEHDCFCAMCVRSGNCELQTLANDFGITQFPYKQDPDAFNWNPVLPLIKDDGKCVKCMRCIQVCDKVQGLKVWDLIGSGPYQSVGVRDGESLMDVNCTL